MEREVEKWITVNGKHIPIYADEPDDSKQKERQIKQNEEEAQKKNKKEKINPVFERRVAEFIERNPIAVEVYRIDRENFAFGKTRTGGLFVGTGELGGTNYYKDDEEGRKRAESYWETNSFAREIKRTKK